jgi:hypothetical protein
MVAAACVAVAVARASESLLTSKSPSFRKGGLALSRKMFSGLTSQCTTPCADKCSSTSSSCRSTTRKCISGRSVVSHARSVPAG